MFHSIPSPYKVGDLVGITDNKGRKIYRVALVTDLRMRLDPVSGFLTQVFDAEFTTYSGSINVSPTSILDRVNVDELTKSQRKRIAQLEERGETTEERIMSETAGGTQAAAPAATPAKPVAAPAAGPKAVKAAPAAQPTVSATKTANAERLARLKAKGDAKAETKAKNPVPKKEKVMQPCKCGCETLVAGHFAQGHDARFKGWLMKIERGQMAVKDLPAKVQKAYEWKKKGEGMIPTKNYKGEPHSGYVKDEA